MSDSVPFSICNSKWYNLKCFGDLLSGFDVGDFSEDAPDDLEGLDASAAHVANLLSTEPADSRFLL